MSELNISRYKLFAVTLPGFEDVTRGELEALGFSDVSVETGGVSFSGTLQDIYNANLWIRSASRILLRIGKFKVSDLDTLKRHVSKYPWDIYLPGGGVVKVNASSSKSRLYHSGAVEERVIEGIRLRTGDNVASWRVVRRSRVSVDMLVVVRIVRDHCVISVDTSGENLYKRGYKKDITRASIRENIAAAILLASGWDGKMPVLDPMCGCGTFVIEAAMIAFSVAPGLYRDFMFEKWKNYDADLWEELRKTARKRIKYTGRSSCSFFASDNDMSAVERTLRNAERAGVSDCICVRKISVARLEPPDELECGWIVTNPPYGLRVKQKSGVAGLYSTLGKVFRTRFKGWNIAILSPDYRLQKALALPVRKITSFSNGGVRVELLSSKHDQ
jgi:putative N6-adenine-specific DNA methylase